MIASKPATGNMVSDGAVADDLEQIINRFSGVRVLVIGDLILDKYTIGKPTRISREAPIAVLEWVRDYNVPGGGTSPACTVASLGGRAYLAGVVGDDGEAVELKEALKQHGVDIVAVITDQERPTIAKKRIVAQVTPSMLQQVARIDNIDRKPVAGDVAARLMRAVDTLLPETDAVLLSNYKSGALTHELVSRVRERALELGKTLAVDSQGDLHLFSGFGLVKCNQSEAEDALRRPLATDEEFETGMRELLAELGVGAVIVTRSSDGMSVMTRDGEYFHIPVTNTSEVFDVTGAGDTVIAVATMAVAAGADVFAAARLANYAAGIVVRKWGNAVPQLQELKAAVKA
jgi:D-glycero-beta-D-manno-heptose-7-phosphate kinase